MISWPTLTVNKHRGNFLNFDKKSHTFGKIKSEIEVFKTGLGSLFISLKRPQTSFPGQFRL